MADNFEENEKRIAKHDTKKTKMKGDTTTKSNLFKDNGKILNDALTMMKHGEKSKTKLGRPLKYATDDEMKRQIEGYFKHCSTNESIPSILGLSLWLGVDRSTVYEWMNGDYIFSNTVKTAYTIIHKFTEDNAIEGNLNPVMYFFIGKNYFGMRDQSETILKTEERKLSAKEQQELIDTIPPVE